MTDPAEGLTWRFWILPTVLALLLVALIATSVVLLVDRRDPLSSEPAVRPADLGSATESDSPALQAVARARLAARAYFTLDHTSVQADMDRLRSLGTPEFVEEYDRTATAVARRVNAQDLKISATLPGNGVATEYLTEDAAQVLVSLDVTTRRGAQRITGAYRTRVVLQRVDEQWFIEALDEVGR